MSKRTLTILLSIGFVFISLSCVSTSVYNNQNRDVVTERLEINSAEGSIAVVIQHPSLLENEKCPVVVLMHGFASSKENPLINNLSRKLLLNGVAVIRFDFNGHGQSYGSFQNMTILSEVKDAKAVLLYVQSLPYAEEIALVGHSQGGVVASILAGEQSSIVNSLVLFAPAAMLEQQAKDGRLLGVEFDPENIPDYIRVYNHRLGRKYILEAQNLNIYSSASSYKGPVCLLHGKSDRVVPFSCSENYHEIYQNSELYLIKGEDHGFRRHRNNATDIALNFLLENLF
ncbi:MAG: alpha/beta fold hydrolase [Spirochaetales bacterium]|nr:alpha/beta fold hydrolase [Spirochaetales bacterium]